MGLVRARDDAKLVLSGVTLAIGLAWPTPLLAVPASVNVRVDTAPPGCISAAELRELLVALPHTVDATQSIEVGVELRAEEPTGYLADVVVQSKGRGTQLRSVATESSNCRELDDALLVVIDALVTGAALDGPPAEKPQLLAPPVRTRRDRTQSKVSVRDHPPTGRVSHSASLGMALELGALPRANASARLGARFAIGAQLAIRVGLGTTPWTSSRALETAKIDFRLTSGRALGCWDFFAARWGYLDACAGLDVGTVTTTSDGLSSGSMTARPAAWQVNEASMGVLLGPFVPEVSGFLAPALVRDSYRAMDTSGVLSTVHRTAALRWGAGLAVGAHFP
jgi:hypothetical protein